MAVATYLIRPQQWQCVQWDGTNSTDVTTVLTSVGWTFTVDGSGNGTAHSPMGYSLPVATDSWVVAGNGTVQIVAAAAFAATYVQGSTWQVAP